MAKRIGELFLEQGLITEEQLQEALEYQRFKKGYLGEILVTQNALKEADLLSYLSKKFNVQFITSEKLEKMAIQSNVAEIIPEKIAEQKIIFPLKYNFNDAKLTIITNAPQDLQLYDELKIILDNVKTITPVVAFSSAIRALISKQYKGDLMAFDRLIRKGIDIKPFAPEGESMLDKGMLQQGSRYEQKENSKISSFTQIINQGEQFRAERRDTTITTTVPTLISGVSHTEFLELLKIFSSILDSVREQNFKLHTQRVVNLAQKMGKALKMSDSEIESLVVAAYLHDVGKRTHVTAFDIRDRSNAERFMKYSALTVKLFGNVNLSKLTKDILTSLYETNTGEGYPQGLRENEIPLGSQVLLAADTYDFLSYVSNIPAPTSFFRINGLNLFSDQILNALKEAQQISVSSGNENNALKKGILITSNKSTLQKMKDLFGRYNIQSFVAQQIEAGAMILKEHGESISFILCDAYVPNSQVTPVRLLEAVRKKESFSKIKFFLFSSDEIDEKTLGTAKTAGVTKIITHFNPDRDIPDLAGLLKG